MIVFTRQKAEAVTLSSTVMRASGFTTWKVRPMPAWQIWWVFSPLMLLPLKTMSPEVIGKNWLMQLKMVVFPEPFGPMSPKISPFSTLKLTSLTAIRPPKALADVLEFEQRHRFHSRADRVSGPARKVP